MKARDIVIGLVFLIILIVGIVWVYKYRKAKTAIVPSPTPNIVDKINQTFPKLNIPDGAQRANLSDVTGGNSVGVATKTEIVANLPDPRPGQIYTASLENSEGKSVLLGTMHASKSGWIINYDSSKYPGYNKVVVLEGSTPVLQGSF